MVYTNDLATLNSPWRGYTQITRIQKLSNYKWLCKIEGSGAEIEFYEDEFTIN